MTTKFRVVKRKRMTLTQASFEDEFYYDEAWSPATLSGTREQTKCDHPIIVNDQPLTFCVKCGKEMQ